jgi:hypothetical protein
MHRARCIVLLVLLAALPALAVAQDAPLTPRVIGADEATILRTWGEPTERTKDTHPKVGPHVAWHYASLPWPDGDPPGRRSVSILFQDGRVVGALEASVGLEDSIHAFQRLQERRRLINEAWKGARADLKAWIRWVSEDEKRQWLVMLIGNTAYSNIPDDRERFVSIVGTFPVAAILHPKGGH